MAELKTYVCPNCGASTTNSLNCEYCGSLLVRFAEKGIDISNTSYKSDTEVLPDLVYNLQSNLKIQEEFKGEPVETDIFWSDENSKWKECGSWDFLKIVSPNSMFLDGSQINTEEAVALVLVLRIPLIGDELDDSSNAINKKGKKLIEEFKQLASYPLFKSHMSEHVTDEGVKWNIWEYYMNFGKDVKGAARLTSEILVKLYDINSYTIYTNEGDAIDDARENWLSENGFNDECEPETDNEVDDGDLMPLSLWQKIIMGVTVFLGLLCGVIAFIKQIDGVWLLSFFIGVISLCALFPIQWTDAKINPRSKATTIVLFAVSLIISAFLLPPLLSSEDDYQSAEEQGTEVVQEEESDEVEQAPQKSPEEKMKELGYYDGVKLGRRDQGKFLRDFVQMGATMEMGLKNMEGVIAPTAYKEDYGDDVSEELLEIYSKSFVEGYKSVVIKE